MPRYTSFLVVIVTTMLSVQSFQRLLSRPTATMSRHYAAEGVDLRGLPVDSSFDFEALQSLARDNIDTTGDVSTLQNALILAAATVYFAYEKRPLGSVTTSLVQLRKSTIPGAELGLFAKEIIPEGVVLGTFPGYVKDVGVALESKKDDDSRAAARRYMWALSEDTVLDPTNEYGKLDLELSYLFGLVKVNTMIARINEPSPGKDCNVFARMKGPVVEVVTERTIYAEEEIFIDYGRSYDRSDYSSSSSDAARAERESAAKRRREEDEMMTFQPIRASDDLESSKITTETSRPDGFISKLKEREKVYKSLDGILSPQDAAKRFSELGSGMFGSDEDQELIDSLMGKQSASKPKSENSGKADMDARRNELVDSFLGDKSQGILGPDDAVRMFGGDNGDLESSVRDQPGNQEGIPITSSASKPGSVVKEGPTSQSLMTPEEAFSLQNRIDALSDDQLQKVFEKMRKSLSDKLANELGSALKEPSTVPKPPLSDQVEKKVMSRAETIDPSVRSKYKSELEAIEDELEKIYQNPLSVWQELMTDPDKYLSEDEIKAIDEDKELQ
jgi:hypothetical protein